MKTFAVINIAKKQLGMHEDDYRALLEQVTGKNSLRDMTESEREQVVAALKKKGFKSSKPGSKAGKRPASNKGYVRLIYVLWRQAHEGGVIQNGSREALRAFVKNETGVSDPEFLDYPTATPVIEALKRMVARGKKAA